jgi:predicted membrane protein (TIGR00267 family)
MLDIIQATIDFLFEPVPLVFGSVTFAFVITFFLLRKRNNDTGELNSLNTDQSIGFNEDSSFIDRIRNHLKLTHGVEIARRYLAMNAFDGILPVIGILMGGLTTMPFQDPSLIYQTSLIAIIGTSLAMLVSGITSSYLTESAERERDIKELEQSLLTDLRETDIYKAQRTTTLVVSLINGLSPSLAALATIIPLLLPLYVTMMIELAFFLSICVGLVILFILGVFLGSVSKTNYIVYGIKTLAAGVMVIVIMLILSTI